MKLLKAWTEGPCRLLLACKINPQTPMADSSRRTPTQITKNLADTGTRNGVTKKPTATALGRHRHPLDANEESISSVVGEIENEISHKATQGHKQDPLRPGAARRVHHAIEQQQKPQACVGKWSGKRRGVSQAPNGAFVEKGAIQMQQHTHQSDQDRQAAHEISGNFP